ncbi:hypothetical protein SDC9_160125 [bioreactor metagenome]|uniref:Uncharacterized protein n=1 Tax=bioreactor metagenome TaxID=1076179 RepID=A0A645FEI3_9ZZZZ
MLMAGRPHCLRRFYHARTVTERKYHYRTHEIIAGKPATVCLRHRYCSLALKGVFAYLPFGCSSSVHAPNVTWISIFIFQAAVESEKNILSIAMTFLRQNRNLSYKFSFNIFSIFFNPRSMAIRTAFSLTLSAFAIAALLISIKK